MSSSFDPTIVQTLYAQNEKIKAVAYVREQTGYDLKTCKDIVEKIGPGGTRDEPVNDNVVPENTSFDLETVKNLVSQHRKIEAVKYVMETSGRGLKESKDFVDSLEEELPTPMTSAQTPIQPTSSQGFRIKLLLFVGIIGIGLGVRYFGRM